MEQVVGHARTALSAFVAVAVRLFPTPRRRLRSHHHRNERCRGAVERELLVVTPDLRGSKDISLDDIDDDARARDRQLDQAHRQLWRAPLSLTRPPRSCSTSPPTGCQRSSFATTMAAAGPCAARSGGDWPDHRHVREHARHPRATAPSSTPTSSSTASTTPSPSIRPHASAARRARQLADLENTLTHELGHVQGLAHTCWDHVTATRAARRQRQADPRLQRRDAAARASPARRCIPTRTMPGETSKRKLSADDVAACARSTSRSPASSAAIPKSTAAAAPRRRRERSRWPLTAVALAALVVALAAGRRRRR